MTKLSLILPIFLLLFINVFGQSDTNAASSPKDTTKGSIASPVTGPGADTDAGKARVTRQDTGIRKDTSVRKAPKTARKELPAITSPDSTGRTAVTSTATAAPPTAEQIAAAKRDSLNALLAAVKFPTRKSPDEWTLLRKTIKSNPYYNFFGTPVIQEFSIHRPNSKDSLFYLLLGIMFYFALIRIFFEKYFSNLFTLFFRVSLRQNQIREQVLQTPLPSLLLNLLFVGSAGLFACNLLYGTPFGQSIGFWVLYLDCIVVLSLLYLLKFLILKFCGWVFNISRATDIYIFVVFLVVKIVGIFLLPFLILITFSGPEMRDILITISLIMIFVLLLYRVFAAYRPIRNEIKLTPFHFFLYLCAFEIAPLLLIYKVLLSYLEKPY